MSHETESPTRGVPSDQRMRVSISRHRRSVVACVVVGLILAVLLGVRQMSSTVVVADVGASTDTQLIAGLGLAAGVEGQYQPTQESYVINHLYQDVSAEAIGDLISVRSSGADEATATKQMTDFLDDYLALRNQPALDTVTQARDAAAARVADLEKAVARISDALNATDVDPSARTSLEVQQAQVVVVLADAKSRAEGYQLLADRSGPIVLVTEPHVLEVSLATKLLPSVLVLFILAGIGVAQAFWRDSASNRD